MDAAIDKLLEQLQKHIKDLEAEDAMHVLEIQVAQIEATHVNNQNLYYALGIQVFAKRIKHHNNIRKEIQAELKKMVDCVRAVRGVKQVCGGEKVKVE